MIYSLLSILILLFSSTLLYSMAVDRMSMLIRIDIRNVEGCWRSNEIIWACSELLTVSFLSVATVKVPLSKLQNPHLFSLQWFEPVWVTLTATTVTAWLVSCNKSTFLHWPRRQFYMRRVLLHLFGICSFICNNHFLHVYTVSNL